MSQKTIKGQKSYLSYDFRQDAAAGIDEPVADLQYREIGRICQERLFLIRRIGIVPVFVEPQAKDFDRLFGQVSPSLSTTAAASNHILSGHESVCVTGAVFGIKGFHCE